MMPVRKSQNWLPNIFNDFFGNEWLARPNSTVPAVNIIETDDEFKVEVAAPGLTKEDFRINISEDNELVITMEHRSESSQGDDAAMQDGGSEQQGHASTQEHENGKQSQGMQHENGRADLTQQHHDNEKQDGRAQDTAQHGQGQQQDKESRQGQSQQAHQDTQRSQAQQGESRMQHRGRSEKKGTYLRREFSYTQFQQSMILPDNIDKEGITASVINGVLTIDIPKKKADEKEKSDRQIQIQ